jgi:arylsulfatase A-like enzyme
MDRQIGRILKALEESGQAENTIIVYAADHGLAIGSHGLLGKQSVYEHSMKAPLVFSGINIPVGHSDALVYLFDIPTTILSLTETVPQQTRERAELAGRDLSAIWRGETASVREEILLAYESYMRSIRVGDWKLIRYTHINKSQLFQLADDPHELRDLAGDPQHAARVRDLLKRLEETQQFYGDHRPLTSDNPQPAEIDLTGRERTPDQHQPDWIVKKYFDLEGWNWRDE